MRRSHDVSKVEGRQLAVASATLGPWSAAGAVGGLGAAIALVTGLIGGQFALGLLADSLSLGLLLFFGMGATGAVLARGGSGGPDGRIRRWARDHPWHVAAVPAGAMLVTDFVMRRILTSEGFLDSLWDGLWRGALVAAVAGVVGSVSASRRRA